MRERLESDGFEHAEQALADLKARAPDFAVNEADLNNWGYRLLGAGRTADGLRIMQLMVTLHPQSGNAYDSLADAWERSGNPERAIANYRRSLELDPANANARERLRALGTAPR